MPKKTVRKMWTKAETALLEKYIKEQGALLRSNFYWNIFLGKMKRRRPPRFFIEMSAKVGRTDSQCKSKFQKFEREIYVEFLEIPATHFRVYKAIRRLAARGTPARESAPLAARKSARKARKLLQAARPGPEKGDASGGKGAERGSPDSGGALEMDRQNDAPAEAVLGKTGARKTGGNGALDAELEQERKLIVQLIREKKIKLKLFKKGFGKERRLIARQRPEAARLAPATSRRRAGRKTGAAEPGKPEPRTSKSRFYIPNRLFWALAQRKPRSA